MLGLAERREGHGEARLRQDEAPGGETTWLQEETKQKHLTVEHIPGELNAADIFTKALLATRFYMLGSLLGLRVLEDEEKLVTMTEELRTPARVLRCACSACMVLQVSDLGQAMWVCEH